MPGFELFGEAEKKQVNEVLETGVLMRYGFDGMRNGNWKAKELEKKLQDYMNVKHAQLVSSGTAALTVAMASGGVGAGDEVIIPSFTFVATFESVLSLNAVPVIVEIDDTLTLSPNAVKDAITDKTKAVMPVHMCGSMADLNSLKQICINNDLLLIEDACQAIGGTYNNQALGTIGDMGCFSFDYVKTITCGEGGAIITNNTKYAQNADHYSDHGHDHIGSDRGAEAHPFLGYNFRISELNAAVGLAQIKRLDEFVSIQKKNYSVIREQLSEIPEIVFRKVPDGGEESYAFLNFFLPDLDSARKVMQSFKDKGIDGCFHYYDNNWHYIRKWQHLIEQKALYNLCDEVKAGLSKLKNKAFPISDHFIGRNISCLIKLSWTEEEIQNRASLMRECIVKELNQ